MTIRCAICGGEYRIINDWHLRCHGLNLVLYKELYLEHPTRSPENLALLSAKIKEGRNPNFRYCRRGTANPLYGKKGPWFGKKLPQSVRDKISRTRLERGFTAWNKGLTKNDDARVQKYASSLSSSVRSVEHCRNISLSKKGHVTSPEHRVKLSLANKLNFADSDFCLWWGQIHASKPTKLELDLLLLLEDNFPGEWKYTGNFTFSVNRCNPDFIHTNGRDICIEVYHPFWKIRKWGSVECYRTLRGQDYADAGWEVLFLDNDDVRKHPDECIRKVAEVLV